MLRVAQGRCHVAIAAGVLEEEATPRVHVRLALVCRYKPPRALNFDGNFNTAQILLSWRPCVVLTATTFRDDAFRTKPCL